MSKPIHTYLDLDVVNNNLKSNAIAPQLRFEDNRNTPFLEADSSEYFCSIVGCYIQTGNSLPIFIPSGNRTVRHKQDGVQSNSVGGCHTP